MIRFPSQVALLLVTTSLCGYAMSQCAITVVPGGHMPDANGAVYASALWDPDGSGPQPEVVVLAGAFDQVGNARARGLALYDPVSRECATLGAGFDLGIGLNQLNAVLVTANNELVVTGGFSEIDGVAASNIAVWNGVSWQPIGTGILYPGESLLELPNGDLLVGGFGNGNPPLMRWDGSTWTAVGTGLVGRVTALLTMPNGDILAGGIGLMPGLVSVARWDGTSWSTFAGNITLGPTVSVSATVRVLRVLANGDVIAAGSMLTAGGVSIAGIARWDGSVWSPLGSGAQGPVYSVVVEPNGDLLVGGMFATIGGITTNRIARWNGTAWSAVGAGLGLPMEPFGSPSSVRTLQILSGGEIVAGGQFLSVGSDADYVQRWDGAEWRQLRDGTGGAVLASAELANGDLVLAGEFTRVEGVVANYVARRVNGGWQPMGSGADAAVAAILELPNGDVVVGGSFTSIGGVTANHIARWDGVAWHAIGTGLPDRVYSLAVDASGQILASGPFPDQLAVWDGLAWNGTGVSAFPIQIPGLRPTVVTTAAGEILGVAINFGGPLFGIRRWTGSGWQPWIPGIGVMPFAVHANGEVSMVTGNSVQHWDGSTWGILGGYFDRSLQTVLALPNGDVLVSGDFTANGTTALAGLARWDGAAWSAVGSGASGRVFGLRWDPEGSVVVVGNFTVLDGLVTAGFAELTTTCLATAASQGSGCAGSAGLNVLSASTLPWLGSDYVSVASGMPANSVAVQVIGFSTVSQTIASILPQGLPGCLLLVAPDLQSAFVPAAGELELRMTLPMSPNLIGATFHQQVVPIELSAGGALLAVTASNALQLTIGSF